MRHQKCTNSPCPLVRETAALTLLGPCLQPLGAPRAPANPCQAPTLSPVHSKPVSLGIDLSQAHCPWNRGARAPCQLGARQHSPDRPPGMGAALPRASVHLCPSCASHPSPWRPREACLALALSREGTEWPKVQWRPAAGKCRCPGGKWLAVSPSQPSAPREPPGGRKGHTLTTRAPPSPLSAFASVSPPALLGWTPQSDKAF